LACAAICSLPAAGCTGASEPSAGRAPCDAPGVTADQIKIGYIFPNSGPVGGQFASSRSGVVARIAEANAEGGVHGRKIVLEWRDDESSPTVNLAVAQDLVDREKVFGIMNVSSFAGGAASYLGERNVPVAGIALEAAWGEYPNMFSYLNRITDPGSVTTWGLFARRHGGSRAVILRDKATESSGDFGTRMARSMRSEGVDVVATLDYEGVAGIGELGRRVHDLGADVLTGAVPAPAFASVYSAAVAAGARFKVVLAPTGYHQSTLHDFGARIAGVYYFTYFLPFEMNTPAHEIYRRAMARYSPELQSPDQALPLTGYINTDLLLRGLDLAGECPSRDAFIRNLRRVHDYRGRGLLSGPVDLGDVGQVIRCYTFVRANATGTAFEVVPDAAPLCGERIPDRQPQSTFPPLPPDGAEPPPAR
jgi:ABC-type branched-subunit amino acid transport system substrate-binding protein